MPSRRNTGKAPSHVALRDFHPTDARATYDVFFDAVHQGAAELYSRRERAAWANSPDMPESWAGKLAAQYTRVALTEGRLIGFMSLDREGYLDMAYVLPAVMGLGVAQKLYRDLEAWAHAQALPLLTVQASHLARPFLEREGWAVIAPQTVLRNGQEIANFVMEKRL